MFQKRPQFMLMQTVEFTVVWRCGVRSRQATVSLLCIEDNVQEIDERSILTAWTLQPDTSDVWKKHVASQNCLPICALALHHHKALSSMVQGKVTAASEICITCHQSWLTKCPPLKAETWQKETSILMKDTGCRSTTLLDITFNSLSIQALNSMINGKAHPEKKILAQFPLYSYVIPTARDFL